jgi:chromate transport protein ChrA
MNAFHIIASAGFILLPIYIMPTLIAAGRRHRHTAAVVALNILLGWTVLGWVAALVWALMDTRQEVVK